MFNMAMLQVRDMDNRLYDTIRYSAKKANRSISQQVITILQEYFSFRQIFFKFFKIIVCGF